MIAERIQAVIDQPDASPDELKATLKESLKLYNPTLDIYIPPSDKQTWNRFRNCASAVYEVTTDPVVSAKSKEELIISKNELAELVKDLQGEVNSLRGYKERYEALEKAQAPEYEKIVETYKTQLALVKANNLRLSAEVEKQKKVI